MHAWRLFSNLLLADEDAQADKNLGLYRFRQHICRPDGSLQCYVGPLTSPSVQFLTHLVISGGCDFAAHELLCLADMENLAALELIQPADALRSSYPDVSDRLVRGWSEKPDPFPLLRVLRVWGIDATTQDSLQWLSRFPSLVLYDVMGAREDWGSAAAHASAVRWAMADLSSGKADSLLNYLLLLAPPEASTGVARELSRSIDSDLVSLCGDSRCSLGFVPYREAPPLLNYLTDTAKVNVPVWSADLEAGVAALGCYGVPFESWAFWLSSFIGQLTSDSDLARQGVTLDSQAVVGPFALPSRPMASLFLGHNGRGGISAKPAYVSRGLFKTRRYAFVRPLVENGVRAAGMDAPKGLHQEPPSGLDQDALGRNGSVPRTGRLKRKRLDDLLRTMSG